MFAIASSFTSYLIYVLYWPQNGKIEQIEVIKFVPRLVWSGVLKNVSILTLNCLRSPLRIVYRISHLRTICTPKQQKKSMLRKQSPW